jgi:ABC-type Mn2+/Zn2+ transport system ATPase subunit
MSQVATFEHASSRDPHIVASLAPSNTPPAVELGAIIAGYGERVALESVDLVVRAGTLLAVVGPNGAGKSTLLKVIAGLLQPWAGTLSVLGVPSGRSARRIAYVPQAESVDWAFPVTVADVVMMGRYPALGPIRRPGRPDRAAVARALDQVGMNPARDRQIGALSGGQRRRVFIARALAADPDLYLLDEPVTGIDTRTQEDLMSVLQHEAARGKTVIASTHDLGCAASCFGKVVAINRRVIADGPASIILDPQVLRATYGGHVVMLEGPSLLLDDAHHHDQPPTGEVHYHEGTGGPL